MMRDEVLQLVQELRDLLRTPQYVLEPTFEALAASEPYRKLVRLGRADKTALGVLADHLRGGDIFLNRAMMEIVGLKYENLQLGPFPSEQEIAQTLVDLISSQVFWTAATQTDMAVVVLSAANSAAHVTTEAEAGGIVTNEVHVTSRASLSGRLQLPTAESQPTP